MGDIWSVLIPQCCIGHCGEWEICGYCPNSPHNEGGENEHNTERD